MRPIDATKTLNDLRSFAKDSWNFGDKDIAEMQRY